MACFPVKIEMFIAIKCRVRIIDQVSLFYFFCVLLAFLKFGSLVCIVFVFAPAKCVRQRKYLF